MSDQPPTRPKPGSLRDRIAAFENQAASQPAPPPPRPKPAGLHQWKPRQPPTDPAAGSNISASSTTPTPSTPPATPAKPTASPTISGNHGTTVGGMSASDARESIKQGASLRERMAALQGKGAFGGGGPTVALAATGGTGGTEGGVAKPKWKPPPPQVPIVPAAMGAAESGSTEEGKDEKGEKQSLEGKEEEEGKQKEDIVATEGDSGEPESSSSPPPPEAVNPEDEERQRRAAIAARMAKLGGARVGVMGPPLGMFAAKKSQPPVPKQKSAETPPAKEGTAAVSTASEPSESTGATSETTMLNSPPPPSSQSKSPPPSMPVPAVPRRTGPPRRKPPKSPVPSIPTTPDVAGDIEVGDIDAAVAEAQERQDVLKDMEPLTKGEKRELEVPPAEEITTMDGLTPDAMNIEEHEAIEPQKEMDEIEESKEMEVETEKGQILVEEPTEIAEPSQEQVLKGGEAEAKDEEEEKRRRIAKRLSKMGGINPLFAPPPVPKRSSLRGEAVVPSSPPQLPPLKRLSLDSMGSASAGRRTSVDSIKEVEHYEMNRVESEIPERDEETKECGENEELEEEHVHEEEGEVSNDALAASMLVETPLEHRVEEAEEDLDRDTGPAPLPPPRPARRSSGFVTRPPLCDDEHLDKEVETSVNEQGRESPPPLPVSPRFAFSVPRAAAASLGSHLTRAEEEVEASAKPVPVPHRSLSLRSSVHSTLSRHSHVEEGKQGLEEDDAEDAGEKEEEVEGKYEEVEMEGEETMHIPPPPTRKVPLPPPPPSLEEDRQQRTDAEPEQEKAAHSEVPLVIPPPTVERKHSKEDSDTFDDLPLPHPLSVRQALAVRAERAAESPEKEIMDDEEGDPIDPSFHTPKRASALLPQLPSFGAAIHKAEFQEEVQEKNNESESTSSDLELARKKTIAERMAKLGGIKFGATPVSGLPMRPPPPPSTEGEEEVVESEEAQGEGENKEVDEEEEERARKERIAVKLAGMGGMRIGMMPQTMMGIPPRPPQRPQIPAGFVPVSPPAAPSRAPPPRPPPRPQTPTSSHDAEWEHESTTTPSEDGVEVEMEESEMEEVHHEDAKLDDEDEHEDGEMVSLPILPPPHTGVPQQSASLPRVRPPVPSTANLAKRSSLSGSTTASSMSVGRKSSSGSTTTTAGSYRPAPTKGQSDYVMVEEPQADSPVEEQSSLPPSIPTRPQRTAPSHPPPTAVAMSDSITSQWELPSIPSGSLGFGLPTGTGTATDLSLSWTDAMDESMSRSTPVPSKIGSQGFHDHRYPPTHAPHAPPPAPPSHAPPVAPSTPSLAHAPAPPADLSADDLMAIWGRVGVQVCETATTMYEKSKKALVGDSTYAGFVRGVLNEVPNAVKLAPTAQGDRHRWGYVVYAQNGSVVQRRISEILPGDVVEMVDAKYKGHKGLQSYMLHVGAAGKETFVGVVTEYEVKKNRLKVLQANQHVGQQSVESVTYKLEDLKSGALKIYRVLEAQ